MAGHLSSTRLMQDSGQFSAARPRLALEALRYLRTKDDAVALVVTVEQLGGERVAPPMTGTTLGIQDDLHEAGVYIRAADGTRAGRACTHPDRPDRVSVDRDLDLPGGSAQLSAGGSPLVICLVSAEGAAPERTCHA